MSAFIARSLVALLVIVSMVLGAAPLAVAVGAGAESRIPIGLVIVGGMSFGTLLTLFVVPTAYTLIAPKRGAELAEVSAAVPAAVPHAGHAD